MKAPWEWREEDLLNLISAGEKESITLDYKACGSLQNTDGKKNELSKDVSAFANSAGGTIVYGVSENGHVPTGLDSGFHPNEISKEWIEQVLNSRIQRRISGIRINQIELSTTRPGRVAYAVHIPQSLDAPHQAADKRFYKRFNFESVPMEEYEVRDVSRRQSSPDLSLRFQLLKLGEDAPHLWRLGLTIENISPVPAEYIVVKVFMDQGIELPQGHEGLICSGEVQSPILGWRSFKCLQFNHTIPSKIPIFAGPRFNALERDLIITVPADGLYCCGWSVAAPGMNERQRFSLFQFPTGSIEEIF